MCYSVSKSTQTKEILEIYKASVDEFMLMAEPAFLLSAFNFPSMSALVQKEGQRCLTSFQWGLIPSWIKSEEDAESIRLKTANAMSETAFEKPSFRSAVKNQRCIIPVNGFFEWKHAGKRSFPHFIYNPNGALLNLAGIYDTWINKTSGEEVRTCSILTTSANTLMADIHNTKKRMPVILKDDQIDTFLEGKTEKETILELCRSTDDIQLKAHSISRLITSRTEDPNTPELLKPVNYPELQPIQTLF